MIEVELPDGTVAEFPDGTPEHVMRSALMKRFGPSGAPPPPPSTTDTIVDVAKSAGTGIVRGAEALVGTVGDLRSLGSAGFDYAGKALGASPESVKETKAGIYDKLKGLPGIAGIIARAPTTKDVVAAETRLTGGLHEPTTSAGQSAQNIAEFIPGALMGPGGVARNAAVFGLVPGLASEAAGKATEGTDYETMARMMAAGLSPLVALKASRVKGKAIPSQDEIRAAADADFSTARRMPVDVDPVSVARFARRTAGALEKDGINSQLAPATHAVLEGLSTPQAGSTVSFSDLEIWRKHLGHVAGNWSNPTEQKAASQFLTQYDDYMESLRPSDVLGGDAQAAQKALRDARANWSALRKSERITEASHKAELSSEASNASTRAGDSAQRRAFKSFVTSDSAGRGFTPGELSEVEKIVRGTVAGNAMRTAGNLLGGGSMAGRVVASGIGGYAGAQENGTAGAAAGAALPLLLAETLHRGAARSVRRQVNRLDEQVRAASPLGRQMAGSLAPPPSPALNMMQYLNAARTAAGD